jgi:hypothetical protein
MPYVGAGKSRLPHSLGDLPTAAEITAMVQAGRRLQSEDCWDTVLGMLGKPATISRSAARAWGLASGMASAAPVPRAGQMAGQLQCVARRAVDFTRFRI